MKVRVTVEWIQRKEYFQRKNYCNSVVRLDVTGLV